MTVDKQPRALYLADVLAAGFECDQEWYEIESAKELRRLHAENKQLRAALEQPQVEQEPVAEVGVIGWKNHLPNSGTVVHWTALMPPLGTKLYTHPQPPRQPLTDEQIRDLFTQDIAYGRLVKLIRTIERAHGIGGEA